MERERSGKVIAIATLLVGILGLSLGFAAFSTRLNITSSADVQIDASVWNVGFSTAQNAITPGTVTGSNSNGSLTLTQFVISQNEKAQLATTNGSSVTYNFNIVNTGDMDAFLNSVSVGQLTCAYASSPTPAPRETDDGHTAGTGTISDADCQAMFTATLTIDSNVTYTNGQSASSGFSNSAKLARPTVTNSTKTPTYVPATLTIAYVNDSVGGVSSVPNGDFIVSLADTTVVYGSAAN